MLAILGKSIFPSEEEKEEQIKETMISWKKMLLISKKYWIQLQKTSTNFPPSR
jgi:hypothetical protein